LQFRTMETTLRGRSAIVRILRGPIRFALLSGSLVYKRERDCARSGSIDRRKNFALRNAIPPSPTNCNNVRARTHSYTWNQDARVRIYVCSPLADQSVQSERPFLNDGEQHCETRFKGRVSFYYFCRPNFERRARCPSSSKSYTGYSMV
jgi:hypothetical protein